MSDDRLPDATWMTFVDYRVARAMAALEAVYADPARRAAHGYRAADFVAAFERRHRGLRP